VTGGVQRKSGKTFLLPVLDRTAHTLMAVLRDWFEPGTSKLLVFVPAPVNSQLHTPYHQPADRFRLCAYVGTQRHFVIPNRIADYVVILPATCMRWGAHRTKLTNLPTCKQRDTSVYVATSHVAILLLTSILSARG
jgi:hypothetical protein